MACQKVYKQGRDDSIEAKVNIKPSLQFAGEIAILPLFYFGVIRLYVAAAATVYQEPRFWRAEG